MAFVNNGGPGVQGGSASTVDDSGRKYSAERSPVAAVGACAGCPGPGAGDSEADSDPITLMEPHGGASFAVCTRTLDIACQVSQLTETSVAGSTHRPGTSG